MSSSTAEPTTQPDPPEPEPSDSSAEQASPWKSRVPLLVRAFVLAALWVAVNAWSRIHFGKDLTELTAVNATLAACTALLAFLPKNEQEDAAADRRRWIERLFDRLLDVRVLAGLWIAFGVLGSFVSSVRVEAKGVGEPVAVTVRATGSGMVLAEGALEQDETLERPLLTSYLKRQVAVEIPGRAPVDRDVGPWWPTVVRVDGLGELPVVFLRVPLLLFSFRDDATLLLSCDDAPQARWHLGGAALVRLGGTGSPGPTPDERLDAWRRDLGSVSEAIADLASGAWRTAAQGPDVGCVAPGQTVRAVLCSAGGVEAGRVEASIMAGSQYFAIQPAGTGSSTDDPDPCADEGSSP